MSRLRASTSASAGRRRGMTMIEVLVAMAILTIMMLGVWRSFSATVVATEMTGDIQERYATVRNAMDRMSSEIATAYLRSTSTPARPATSPCSRGAAAATVTA